MSLSDLIKKNDLGRGATATVATVATVATHPPLASPTVAIVAPVAVGTPQKQKSESELSDELRRVIDLAKAVFGDDVTTESVDQTEDLHEFFNERAGILEYDGGLARVEAELESARITCQYAMNAKYSWRSLCEALAAYPEIVSMIPNTPGLVDHLPLGLARYVVIPESNFIKGKDRVVRQGVSKGHRDASSPTVPK